MKLSIDLKAIPKIEGLRWYEVQDMSELIDIIARFESIGLVDVIPSEIKKHIKVVNDVYTLSETVMSWYNQSHIYNWFLRTIPCDDVTEEFNALMVCKKDLTNLLIDCETVIQNRYSEDAIYVVKKLLPTSANHFRSESYNDDYYDTLHQTTVHLKSLLKEIDFDKNNIFCQFIFEE